MAEKESGMKICLTCHSALKHLLTDACYEHWICPNCGERAAVAVRVIDKENENGKTNGRTNKSGNSRKTVR
jgi:predicted RNA-binding Zn-ribbon protein involved in translation (DUF1610 family)